MNSFYDRIDSALGLVRDGLRSGAIKRENFDMSVWHNHCGTVACIGGWAAAVLERAGNPDARREVKFAAAKHPPLELLFHPWTSRGEIRKASPKQAADAIERYLAGEDPW